MNQKLSVFPFFDGVELECGAGWNEILHALGLSMAAQNPEARAVQVKEKFGLLRIYAENLNREGVRNINSAEVASASVCERCGEPGKTRGTHWLATLCDECGNKRRRP